MNTIISFKIAKLLKEKGFDVKDRKSYQMYGSQAIPQLEIYDETKLNLYKDYCLVPTIAEVIMWLYENYSLWILALPTITGDFAYKIIDVQMNPENPIERPPYNGVNGTDYNSPTKAYEAAIEYCLTNLI